jgi:hypothetical protein
MRTRRWAGKGGEVWMLCPVCDKEQPEAAACNRCGYANGSVKAKKSDLPAPGCPLCSGDLNIRRLIEHAYRRAYAGSGERAIGTMKLLGQPRAVVYRTLDKLGIRETEHRGSKK